ncbi:MAG: hypothetical protein M1356_11405 [Gammaproteobacteria bacterium]|nr:hypothetical protein [Gammaproteobacteria bacterium]
MEKSGLVFIIILSLVVGVYVLSNVDEDERSSPVPLNNSIQTNGSMNEGDSQGLNTGSMANNETIGRDQQLITAPDSDLIQSFSRNNEAFKAEKYDSLIHSADFMSKAYEFMSADTTSESVNNQMYLYNSFRESIATTPEFSSLSLEMAECDVDLCLVSVSGVEQLSDDDRMQLQRELLFNRQGLSKVAAQGVGGTFGVFEDDDGRTYFRIIYVTNSRFSGVN